MTPSVIVVFAVALRVFAIAAALLRFPLRIFAAALGIAPLPFFRGGAAGEVRDEDREKQKYEGPFHLASIPEKAAVQQWLKSFVHTNDGRCRCDLNHRGDADHWPFAAAEDR